MLNYREPLFRPPAEANSLIFQVSYGCPHNSCCFCGMYKGVCYEKRDISRIAEDIKLASRLYPATKRIFLGDGDAFYFSYTELLEILKLLNYYFPKLNRVGSYANGSSIAEKSFDELVMLRKYKLTTLYIGLESGWQKLLDLVNKQQNIIETVNAVQQAQRAGIRCSIMILLGLGGRKYSSEHALKTAEVLNLMQPKLLSALRFIEIPKLTMYEDYEGLSQYEAVRELIKIIENLNLAKTVFRANHSSNPIPLGGRFPADKQKLLQELYKLCESDLLDRFSAGDIPLL